MNSEELKICERGCDNICRTLESADDCYESCVYSVCSDSFTGERMSDMFWREVYAYVFVFLLVLVCVYLGAKKLKHRKNEDKYYGNIV